MKFLFLFLFPLAAFAQSVPNGTITQGEVWTPAQWNYAWQSKQDYPIPAGGVPFSALPTIGANTVLGCGPSPCAPGAQNNVSVFTGDRTGVTEINTGSAFNTAVLAASTSQNFFVPPGTYLNNTVAGCSFVTCPNQTWEFSRAVFTGSGSLINFGADSGGGGNQYGQITGPNGHAWFHTSNYNGSESALYNLFDLPGQITSNANYEKAALWSHFQSANLSTWNNSTNKAWLYSTDNVAIQGWTATNPASGSTYSLMYPGTASWAGSTSTLNITMPTLTGVASWGGAGSTITVNTGTNISTGVYSPTGQIAVGQIIDDGGVSITTGTKVTSVSGNCNTGVAGCTLGLSNPVSGTNAGDTVTFTNVLTTGMYSFGPYTTAGQTITVNSCAAAVCNITLSAPLTGTRSNVTLFFTTASQPMGLTAWGADLVCQTGSTTRFIDAAQCIGLEVNMNNYSAIDQPFINQPNSQVGLKLYGGKGWQNSTAAIQIGANSTGGSWHDGIVMEQGGLIGYAMRELATEPYVNTNTDVWDIDLNGNSNLNSLNITGGNLNQKTQVDIGGTVTNCTNASGNKCTSILIEPTMDPASSNILQIGGMESNITSAGNANYTASTALNDISSRHTFASTYITNGGTYPAFLSDFNPEGWTDSTSKGIEFSNYAQYGSTTVACNNGLIGNPIATLGAITAGSGYAPGTYTSVPLTYVTSGNGAGALATVVVNGDGTVHAGGVTLVNTNFKGSGYDYLVNDNLTVTNSHLGGSGSGFAVPVATINALVCTMAQFTTLTGAASGGTLLNLDIGVTIPNGSSAGTYNYGIKINGNGGASASQNWAIYYPGTADSELVGGLDYTPIGAVSPSTGAFSSLSSTSTSFNGGTGTSVASWGTTSPIWNATTATLNDTTASGTITNEAAYSIQVPTFTSTGGASTTITNATTMYLGVPLCTGGLVCTNFYSLIANGGVKSAGAFFGTLGETISGAAINLNNNSNFNVNLCTGTCTGTIVIGNAGTTGKTQLAGLASSSSAQTGTVCIGASNVLTYDTTTTCLLSDGRLKMNIDPLDVGLAEVMQLKPVSYDLHPEVNPTHLGRQVGLIAQDVIEVDPRLASVYQSGPDAGTPSGVRYEQMVALLVKAIQEQQAEIDDLKRQLAH